MATVAVFLVPADAFPLGSLFTDFPEVHVELERLVPTNEAIIPYCWVRGADSTKEAAIEDAFRNHPDVKHIELVDEVDGEYLLRVEWNPDYQGLLKAVAETNTVIVSGTGTAGRWTFEVRSDDRAGVSRFQEYCRDHDISLELAGVHALSSLDGGGDEDLTDAQREALVLAYERGYFDTPRETTLEEIADELGITRQSLSSRLRRGHRRLIRGALVEL